MNIGVIEGTIRLHDQFSGPLNNAANNLNTFGTRLRSLTPVLNGLGGSTSKAGSAFSAFASHIKNTLIHVGTAVVAYKGLAAAVDSVAKNVEFERTMTQIGNVTQVTSQELTTFRNNLDALIADTGRGPQELAEGFYNVASVLDDAAVSADGLANASRLSAIGLGETNDIARVLASTINAYGVANIDAAEAADQLLMMVKLGGAEADEVAGSLGRVVALAAEMDVSFAEVGASVATFTRLGVGADEAVTALRGTLADLLKPSKAGQEALAALGLSAEQLRANIRDNGLMEVLTDLVERAESTSQLSAIIDNIRALSGVLANAGRQGEVYADILKQIESSQGAVGDAMEEVRKSPAFQWDVVIAQLEQVKILFGELFLPSAISGLEKVATALRGVRDFIKFTREESDLLKEAFDEMAGDSGRQAKKFASDWSDPLQQLGDDMAVIYSSSWPEFKFAAIDTLLAVNIGINNFVKKALEQFGKFVKMLDTISGFLVKNPLFTTMAFGASGFQMFAGMQQSAQHALSDIKKLTAGLNDNIAVAERERRANQAAYARRAAEATRVVTAEDRARMAAKAAADQLAAKIRQQEEAAKAARELAAAIGGEVAEAFADLDAELLIAEARWEFLSSGKTVEQADLLADAMKTLGATSITPLVEELYRLMLQVQRAAGWTKELTDDLKGGDKGFANVGFTDVRVDAADRAKEDTKVFLAEWKNAWDLYGGYALDAIDVTADHLKGAIHEAIMTGSVSWTDLWKSLTSTLLDIFLDFLEEMVRNWIKSQLTMAATSYATGNAKGGKGTGADYVKTAQTAYGAYNAATGAGAAGGAGGFSSLGVTANMAAGVAGAAVFAYIIYKGFFEDFQNKFAKAVIGGNGLVIQATNTAQHGQKHVQGLSDAIQGVSNFVFDFLKSIDVQMTQFGKVTISKIGAGWIVGNTLHKTLEEAVKAATAHMIKYGEFADSVSLLVKTAIKNTKDITLEAINANIEFARMIENIGKSQVELDVEANWTQFLTDLDRAVELFRTNGEALGFAIAQLGLRLSQQLQAARDQITGEDSRTPEEDLRARQQAATLFNAQKKLSLAELQLRKLDVESRYAALQANAGLIQAENQLRQAQLEATRAYLEALGVLIEQIGQIADIDVGSLVPNLGGGGGGGGGKGDVRDWLRDRQQQFDDSLLTDWQRQQQEIMRLYQEQLDLAGDDIELRAQLIALRDREIQQLRQQLTISAVDKFQQFMGIGPNSGPFGDLRADAQAAADAINDSPMGDARKARMVARIWEELGDKIRERAQELTAGLAGSFASMLERAGLEKEANEALLMQKKMEWQLELINLRLRFEALRKEGFLLDATGDKFDQWLDMLEGVDPNVLFGPGGGLDDDGRRFRGYEDAPTTGVDDAAKKLADELDRARKMLGEWMKEGRHPLIVELEEFYENLAFLKRVIGDTAEVQEAGARKFKSILSKYLDPIQEFLDGMAFDSNSVLGGADQFFAAQEQFRTMFAAIKAGDLTQLDKVTDFADLYRTLSRSFTGGEGRTFIEKEIADTLRSIIALAPQVAGQSLPIGSVGNPSTIVSPALQLSIEQSAQAQLVELRVHTVELKSANAKLGQMATALDNPLNVRNIA